MNNNTDSMGKRIRTIRDGIGITRSEFAEITQLNERRIKMIENEERRITAPDITAICTAFPWATKWIVYGGPIEEADFNLGLKLPSDLHLILPKGIKPNGSNED